MTLASAKKLLLTGGGGAIPVEGSWIGSLNRWINRGVAVTFAGDGLHTEDNVVLDYELPVARVRNQALVLEFDARITSQGNSGRVFVQYIIGNNNDNATTVQQVQIGPNQLTFTRFSVQIPPLDGSRLRVSLFNSGADNRLRNWKLRKA